MAKNNDDISQEAAETPNVLSPIVGISREDLLSAFGAIAGGAVRHPFTVMQHMGAFGREVVDIVSGKSELKPEHKDRRFVDKAWQQNPLYMRLMQGWMAMGSEVHGFIDALELDRVEQGRAKLVADIFIDALAPTNTIIGNPSAIKHAIDTGGMSLVNGVRNVLDDMRNNHGMPSQVDKKPFKVGENVACSEGAVVFRDEMLELMQYSSTTDEVRAIPLLFVPPQINKYYVLDLAPEKSIIRYLQSKGYQVFVVSWFNPTIEQSHWGLADYVEALINASSVVMSITKSKSINISGGCSGGITTASLLSHLAAKKDTRINSVTFWVCVLDPQPEDSDVGVMVTKRGIEMARKRSAKKGILSGSDLSRVFAWLRPNDLIWNYVVNNYLHGNQPPAFDVLFWNNDSTNLSAALHSDYLALYEDQPFANPGTKEFMGEMLDLGNVTVDAFIVGGVTDHITPWKACYRTVGMLGGKKEFVLSNSGHIQAILNPPGNPKAKFFANENLPETAEEWAATAHEVAGSWWDRWSDWLSTRSGELKKAPAKLGSKKYPPMEAAPGTYIHG
ncbi:MAG: alpha/beta fold hydrolase [Rhizobiales bacterium]|nr:alpha/beta fold hydrolase [Hyphomicrobiales bacterium]